MVVGGEPKQSEERLNVYARQVVAAGSSDHNIVFTVCSAIIINHLLLI